MTRDELQQFMNEAFPEASYQVVCCGAKNAQLQMATDQRHFRPGGTVSGPTMFGLADAAIYAAILAELGPVALAVTTNLSINFLNKPPLGRDIVASCDLIKAGKRLVVAQVTLHSEGLKDPVAHATGTYSIPPGTMAT